MKLDELKLDPELLWLIVFGPGYGESILLVVPGGHWMAVDSLQRAWKRSIAGTRE